VGSPAIDRLIDLDLAFQAAVVEASTIRCWFSCRPAFAGRSGWRWP